ncbi:hypothetical protein FLL45_06245 [Aliikangiella marina]|uniref:Uncharacterized protein n=1 Tax=Aliikangiella marina TaxID=1712262 RepID=A0A545TBH1_9GAMM|nr:hypothetical protein [Aliikangiella marina]TQV74559.1 hypothetical protein FLL45_06245 [Aliikangiella marina]
MQTSNALEKQQLDSLESEILKSDSLDADHLELKRKPQSDSSPTAAGRSQSLVLTEPNVSQIGGSLQFFRLLNWALLAICGLAISVLIGVSAADFTSGNNITGSIGYMLQLLPFAVFSAVSLKLLKQPNPSTPDLLNKHLTIFLAASISIYGLLHYLSNNSFITSSPFNIIGNILYYIVCTNYFSYSQTVRAYFGDNAYR